MDQDVAWYGGGPRPRPRCARWGPSSPPKKRAQPLYQFSVHVYCDQTAGCIKIPLGKEASLGPGHIVNGDPAAPEKGYSRQFSAHVYCGLMAGWIKMPLGTKVVLSPCHIRRSPNQPRRGHSSSPVFSDHVYVVMVAHLSYCWVLVAQLTVECPYALQWTAPSPSKLSLPWGSGPPI